MDHYDHSKNSEILAFLTLSSLNLTHMQTKTPLTLPFYTFSTLTQKVHLTKVKQILNLCKLLETKPVK